MVVAQVIGNLSIGGAERLFVNLCNSLGSEAAIVILIGDTDAGPNLASELDGDIKIHRIRVRKRSWIRDVRKLANLLRETRCDIVHTHMFWPNLFGAMAARIAGLPLVTSEHGRNEWKAGWHKWLEVNVISRFATVRLCVSEDILRRRRDLDGVPADLLKLVPNGTVVPRVTVTGKSPVLVGSVGRLVDAKDFPTLVRAASILVQRGVDLQLEIVGDGIERQAIEAVIEQEGAGSYVTLVGSQTNVDEWLGRWSIFASSSVREGQPVALLEAMAAGLPCVVTAVGGVPSTIENGVEGIVVPSDNPEAIADGMETLLGDVDLRDRYGRAARYRVIRDFSIESLASTCRDIYGAALGSSVAGVD